VSSPAPAIPTTYAALRREVETVILKGREQIERAWVQTYHETGRLIHQHLQSSKARADYGAKVLRRLSADTGISERTLYECRHFFRCFPIPRHGAKLSWAHYRALCQVENETDRAALLHETVQRELTSPQLIERVRALNAAPLEDTDRVPRSSLAPPTLLTPKRGAPGVHRVVARGEALAVDLGFKLYLTLDGDSGCKAGDFATFDARGRPLPAPDATKADLFTYAATLRRIVDGDTLEIEVRLPRGYTHVMKLRLRGLDCPEIDTPEGKAAKRFVEALFATSREITLYTTKPDKYDRYLADVFVPTASDAFTFLNNALLAASHARRKDDWAVADWER
jgi:endonuclease YncB( thermonuclease family)